MTTDTPTKRQIDAAKQQEFIDWKFEEWLNEPDSPESDFEDRRDLISQSTEQIRSADGMSWLRAAFRAGAKR